ncbi:hypothetical protein [Oleiagrimonas sp.]|jgi:hypothetical protein|uniref:hypothetical protein n=1 Tax=Oleiagrimonas sp. TaxID=2010330 RepID=UPI002612DD67|nr:hypothetical protein [Oleiagrimonas sp.]MDA3914672.1 hypothetical protein [Oleiagrimonas sp.]
MKRKFLLTAIAATLIAGSGSFVFAQDASKPAPPSPSAAQQGMHGHPDWNKMHGMHGMDHGRGMHGHRHGGSAAAVIADLHQISRLYVMQGKARELPGFYKGVLARTQDPMVRNYIYHSLARAQMMPKNPDAAIATLRTSLDENLTRLNAEKPHKR